MSDFLERFGERMQQPDGTFAYEFSNAREGLIVALLSVGTLIGCTTVGWIADTRLGRRWSTILECGIFCVGNIIQITSVTHWYQLAIGRLIAGVGVGGLSVLVPLYQSETAPKRIRGTLVSTYQLFITFGILCAYAINAGTETLHNIDSWRITVGISFIWVVLLALGMFMMPESPRFSLLNGREEDAIRAMEKIRGVPRYNVHLAQDLNDMRAAMNAQAGKNTGFKELLTGKPKIFYRLVLGTVLQGIQQLTGANYFFYYGTTVFNSVGLSNSFVTSIILGAVNFGCTFGGLYVMEHFGRRRPLIIGALWMAMCFLVFASVGISVTVPGSGGLADAVPTQQGGYVMIVFACLFILGFSTTWSCGTWVVNGEIHAPHLRAKAIGITTAGNWLTNFLLAFFTPFIAGSIGFAYGYVFAGCLLAGAVIVYFFLYESKGLTLEEINEMYGDERCKPWTSSSWRPAAREDKKYDAYTREEEPKLGGRAAQHLEGA